MAKTRPVKQALRKTAITLKVTLRGSTPPIWRRLVMPMSASLAELHAAIQAAMGWTDDHLHIFEVGHRRYGAGGALEKTGDENLFTLDKLIRAGHRRFTYTYDFGDNWEHLVAVEKLGTAEDGLSIPACVAGGRACPPEDCGGVWGYSALLDALADPSHPDHAEQREWVAEDFDPDAFDVGRADAAVKYRIG